MPTPPGGDADQRTADDADGSEIAASSGAITRDDARRDQVLQRVHREHLQRVDLP